ncbi:hypothetical protein AB1L42_03525 [Thalassoglobus sp. JC818]|uniref:hypothetical protein n=1 Tax=Thalassoglobus sp. JC818 TaxID=3232136 RepID=UPI0034591C7E
MDSVIQQSEFRLQRHAQVQMNSAQQTELDRKFAPIMFFVTLAFLAIAGVGMHVLQDSENRFTHAAHVCGWTLVGLWTVYVFEAIMHMRDRGQTRRSDLLYCLFPPLRLGARDHIDGKTVWLPWMGWKTASDELANDIELRLGYTMIAIALLILPLLGFEFYFEAKIKEVRSLGMAVQIAQAFIWFAFAAEFILTISLVSKKLKFVKEHLLDLAIICLPMIAFMRAFRLTGAARLSRLSKSARVFRLRGLAMRAWRAILILQIVDRILHRDQEKRLRMLEEQIAEKQKEIEELRDEARLVRESIEAQKAEEAELEQQDTAVNARLD